MSTASTICGFIRIYQQGVLQHDQEIVSLASVGTVLLKSRRAKNRVARPRPETMFGLTQLSC